MKVVSIYVDEGIWGKIVSDSLREAARTGKRVSVGKFLTEAYIGKSPMVQSEKVQKIAVAKPPDDKKKRLESVKKIPGVASAAGIPFVSYSKEVQLRKKKKA